MIFSIARKEFRDAWRDGRFRLAAVVVLVLLGVAMLLAGQQVERTDEERRTAAKVERDNWLNQDEKNSHSAGHYGMYVFKPTAPLAVFDRGIEPFVGTTVFLEAHKRNPLSFLPAQDATAMRRFGDLTAATALQMLVPLLVVLLTFGALAGERETGTLRQALSLGVRPTSLVLGKAVGLGAALAVLLVPVGILAAIALSKLTGGEGAGGNADTWIRFAWMCGAYATYLAIILAVCITVSALARTARSALAILLTIWAVNAIIAPRLASDVAQRLEPTPKLAAFEAAIDDELEAEGMPRGSHHFNQNLPWVQEVRRRAFEAQGNALTQSYYNGLLMLEAERLSGEVYEKHYAKLWDLLDRQDATVTWGGLIAPLLGLRSASMALAGTDFSHHRHFATAAEKHRLDFVRVLNEHMMEHGGRKAGRELWESLPEFRYEPRSSAAALYEARPGLIVLGVWALVAWTLMLLAAPRLEPN
jgi:ABC-2 type transport system permease protein